MGTGVDLALVRLSWAGLAQVDNLKGVQVVVRPASLISPEGWVGVLSLENTLTVTVPTEDLLDQWLAIADGFAQLKTFHSEQMVPLLPDDREIKGPASLFYFRKSWLRVSQITHVEEVAVGDLDELLTMTQPDEADESGIADISSLASVLRDKDGAIIAACGWRLWNEKIAHLSVLTHPRHRRTGHGLSVAAAAIDRAISLDLVPQWRARPAKSKSLALKLGFDEIGFQLSLRPS